MTYRMPDWNRVKAHYLNAPAAIHKIRDEWVLDPYEWDHGAQIQLSPIENALWHDIRAENLVLYPQFPVGRYFVDFGNPAAKVAIECDGAAFHQDGERDARRQGAIEALGWTVYRFTGKDCLTATREVEDDYGRIRLELGTAQLRLRDIGAVHRISRHTRSQETIDEVREALYQRGVEGAACRSHS